MPATAILKPKTILKDGEVVDVDGSGRKYTCKRTGDHYYCSCPSWRNAGGAPDARTCKHLKSILGDRYEEWRLEQKLNSTMSAKPKRKITADEDEDGEQNKDGKRTSSAKRRKPSARDDDGDDDDDDDDEEEEDEDEEVTVPSTGSSRRPRAKRVAKPVSRLKDSSFKPLLAEKWDLEKGIDPTGWWASEKLDGVRAYWTGTRFQSREGNPFNAPPWFIKRLPKDITLDGELFTERAGFQDVVSIVKGSDHSKWKFTVTFEVFDCPSKGHLPFEQRMKFVKELLEDKLRIKWVNVVKHTRVKSKEHVIEMLDEVTGSMGEGLMLRESGSKYVQGRSKTLLKVKRFFDADAIVRGHEKGTGKNSDVMGACRCEMLDTKTNKPTGVFFKVGSGFTDAQRKSPPKVGSVIIYRYQELSRSGNPRFPTFVGERAD